jgi:predicted DNA-binding protein (UPF0251 family)
MPRPVKCRRVEFFPENTYFMPLGKRKCEVEEITLKIEELEAMRLKDIEGLSQEECAERMQVSRQTFQNNHRQCKKESSDSTNARQCNTHKRRELYFGFMSIKMLKLW